MPSEQIDHFVRSRRHPLRLLLDLRLFGCELRRLRFFVCLESFSPRGYDPLVDRQPVEWRHEFSSGGVKVEVIVRARVRVTDG